MPNVRRFKLNGTTELYIPGVGLIRKGYIDVPSDDTVAIAQVRSLLAIYSPVEETVDTSVAAVIPTVNLPDPYPQYMTLEELRASGGGSARLGVGNRLVTLGDSITIAGETPSLFTYGGSYGFFAALKSEQRVQHVHNAGIGGQRSDEMLARFDADVKPYAPTMVSLMAGTNDSFQAVPDATYRSNIRDLVGKIRGIGAVPVLCTILPITSAGNSQRLAYSTWNRWLTLYASAQGIPLVNFHAVMVDPATGNLRAEYDSGDGTHPNVLGQNRMGQAWIDAMSSLLPSSVPLTAKSNNDPTNLLTGGLFQTAAANGIGDGWFTWGSVNSGTPTRSIVADPLVAGGKMQRLTNTGVDGSHAIATNISSGWSVGDRLLVSCLVSKTGGGPGAALQTQNFGQNVGQGYRVAYVDWQVSVTRGLIAFENVVGPGSSTVTVILQCNGGTGSIDYGEVTVVNATTGNLLVP